MNQWHKVLISFCVAALLIAAWTVYFHNDAVAGIFPKDSWMHRTIAHLGQARWVVSADADRPDPAKSDVLVHVAPITLATVHRYVDGYGDIEPQPAGAGQEAGSANIASAVTGQVTRVLCVQGQQVKAGDALIQLDDRQAIAAEEHAQAVLTQQQAALAVLQAAPRPGAAQPAPSPEQLAEARAKVQESQAALASAKAARDTLTLRSPIDATVVAILVNPGEAAYRTRTLVQLVAMDRLMVDVDLPAEELPDHAAGLPAQVFVGGPDSDNDEDDEYVLCKVSYVSGQVEPKNGAVPVQIDLPPPDGKHLFRPGQAVAVRIAAEAHRDVLVVPEEAVVTNEDGDSVIAILDGNIATQKTVGAGLEEKGLVEVSAPGLKAGMMVVTTGAAALPRTTRVRIQK